MACRERRSAAAMSSTYCATMNSSAPIRATVPWSLVRLSSRNPTSRSRASPTSWPNSSLTSLSPVISQHITATMRPPWLLSMRLKRSCRSAQFGKPVTASSSDWSRSRSSIWARLRAALSTRPTPRMNTASSDSRRPKTASSPIVCPPDSIGTLKDVDPLMFGSSPATATGDNRPATRSEYRQRTPDNSSAINSTAAWAGTIPPGVKARRPKSPTRASRLLRTLTRR